MQLRKSRLTCFFAFLLLFILSLLPAFSQSESTAASSVQAQKASVPAELIDYFSGSWTGKGKFASSGKELESDFSFVPDLENQCLVVRQKERPPNKFQFVAVWSMDSVSGQMVMLMAANYAGARLFRSAGWQDGKLVFQSVPQLHAYFALERFTFERQSSTVFRTTYEMSPDEGKTWKIGDQQTFTKTSS